MRQLVELVSVAPRQFASRSDVDVHIRLRAKRSPDGPEDEFRDWQAARDVDARAGRPVLQTDVIVRGARAEALKLSVSALSRLEFLHVDDLVATSLHRSAAVKPLALQRELELHAIARPTRLA